MSKEFWRRAIIELTEAVKVDRLNTKALWRRYRCHRALKHYAEAEADIEALLAPELREASAKLLAANPEMAPEKVRAPVNSARLPAKCTRHPTVRSPRLAEPPTLRALSVSLPRRRRRFRRSGRRRTP